MNKILNRFSLLLCGLLAGFSGLAQDKPEMADIMRSNGKIYVVVAVCLLILVGLFLYVVSIDRKLSKKKKNRD